MKSRCKIRLATRVVAVVCGIGSLLPVPCRADSTIHWWYQLAAPSFGSAACGDIDGDGHLEIVFGTYFNDEHVYALNADNGTLLWSFDTGGCNDASPVIYDVDQDGELEVVIPASSPYMVYCFDGATGAVEWSHSTGYPNCIDSPPAVADVDNDGRPEIILGTFYGHVVCLNGEDGSEVWQANLGTNSYIQTDPAILDCDGDGQLDVVVAQWQGDQRVYALRGDTGQTLWFSSVMEDWMYHGCSFADIDEDSRPELVIGNYDGDVYALNAENGSLLWEYPGVLYVGAPTSIADLNNDAHLEIVYAYYTTLKVLTRTGQPLWSFSTGGSIFRGAAIADADGNGVADVAFGSDDGTLRVLRGNNGSILWTHNLQAHYGRPFEMDHAPIIADFNEDDSLDVFIIGGYGTSSQPQNNHGRAYCLTLGAGNGPDWPMFRHDPQHSALYTGPQYNVALSLTPINPPIVIPAGGGSFNYNAALTNSETTASLCDVWIRVQLPNNTWYAPILGPMPLTLPAGGSLTRLRTQAVPGSAPAGLYTYRGWIGDYPAAWDSSSFTFAKSGFGTLDSEIGAWTNTGESFTSEEPASITDPTPTAFTLHACSPNPFNASTMIRFDLLQAGWVRLEVFDTSGRLVSGSGTTPTTKEWYSEGRHAITFDGSRLASGIYLIRVEAAGQTATGKLVLLK
jgi:outer membrane protein assembly factor BamB